MRITAVLRHRVPGLSKLPIIEPKSVAMAYARHSQQQWTRFYAISYKEGVILHEQHPKWRWGNVPPDIRLSLQERINARLQSEDIPEIDGFVLGWRMSRIFSWLQKQIKLRGRRFPKMFPERKLEDEDEDDGV
ncbi:hypothetical protein K504DRAFT_536569 [Pleomassaria siparia CBS 279.74]|uniref:Uncharacterized protein n=1 Tax=Pleomassaria siparia CBS 279.74 TaxID=1314801 RepID=A0A6G1K0L7_9PLEO|nr:hypothetical protein K504DRAFT_536569 [Pleomassaria siparia CBS 279.74]